MSMKQNVVVIGGGSAGSQAIQQLSVKLDYSKQKLTLISSRPYLLWMLAGARIIAANEDDLIRRALIPYDRLLPAGKGHFKVGTVVAIEENSDGKGGEVILENRERVRYDGELEIRFSLKSLHRHGWSSQRWFLPPVHVGQDPLTFQIARSFFLSL
jgi:NADH dehydrogenase FAD-containing subunit